MRKITEKTRTHDKPTLKLLDPQIDESANYHRQKAEAILRRHESLDSARELLGWDIVCATEEGLRRVRIMKTRSFSGMGKKTHNKEGIVQPPGHIYIMKSRAGMLLNISTGREGEASCVWVEEAKDLDSGMFLKGRNLVTFLGMENADRQPVFSEKFALVPGENPNKIERLSPAKEKASDNTTGIFEAVY